MKRLLVLAFTLFMVGCEFPPTAQEVASTQTEAVAQELMQQVGEDGWYIRNTETKEVDPWGNELIITYMCKGGVEFLCVRSKGADGNLYTDDDIFIFKPLVNEKAMQAQQEMAAQQGEPLAVSVINTGKPGLEDKEK